MVCRIVSGRIMVRSVREKKPIGRARFLGPPVIRLGRLIGASPMPDAEMKTIDKMLSAAAIAVVILAVITAAGPGGEETRRESSPGRRASTYS
jgi:hypothetical protein